MRFDVKAVARLLGITIVAIALTLASLAAAQQGRPLAGAIAPDRAAGAQTGSCGADRYKPGDPAPQSLAAPARLLRPDTPREASRDFRPDRLNVMVGVTGRVLLAWCG